MSTVLYIRTPELDFASPLLDFSSAAFYYKALVPYVISTALNFTFLVLDFNLRVWRYIYSEHLYVSNAIILNMREIFATLLKQQTINLIIMQARHDFYT